MHHKSLHIMMFFAMIAWGETWVSAKVLSLYLDPYELVFWRFFFSAVGLIPVIYYLKLSYKIHYKNLLIAIILSFLLILYNNYFFLGTKYGEAGFGGVLVTTLIPINTFIILALFFSKKAGKRELLGLSIGAIGTATILNIFQYDLDTILQNCIVYFLIASIIWPLVTILSSYTKDVSAIVISFYMFLFTALFDYIFILDFTLSDVVSYDSIFWLNILLLSLFGTTFGTSIYFIATSKLGSKIASSYFFLVPLSAIIFSSIFLDEVLEYTTVIGGILTITAVYIISGIRFKLEFLNRFMLKQQ